MPQRPTLPSPYLNAIDCTVSNDFCCLINDKDVIVEYKFVIISITNETDLNGNTNVAYSYESKETIYGGSGNDSYLVVSVPEGELEEGEYKWKVELTDNYGKTATSREYYFTCINTPTLTIECDGNKNLDKPIASANATFSGEYTSSSPLVYHRFILYKDDEVIKDTGDVYSQYLKFEYDMFVPGKYVLKLKVENEGKMVSEQMVEFQVDYPKTDCPIAPLSTVSPYENSVVVDFANAISIPGKYDPSYAKYEETLVTENIKGAYIPSNTSLYWRERTGTSDELEIDEDKFSVYAMVKLPYGKQGDIIRLSGDNEVSVSFDGFQINYEYTNQAPGYLSVGEYEFGCVEDGKINDDVVYYFDFDDNTTYYLDDVHQFVFQNPMNVSWWLITISNNGVSAEKVQEEVVTDV